VTFSAGVTDDQLPAPQYLTLLFLLGALHTGKSSD
jgi:hypothetical protein